VYQTQETVFYHITNHRKEGGKKNIFDQLQGVWKCGQTLSLVFDNYIFSIKTKIEEKTANYTNV